MIGRGICYWVDTMFSTLFISSPLSTACCNKRSKILPAPLNFQIEIASLYQCRPASTQVHWNNVILHFKSSTSAVQQGLCEIVQPPILSVAFELHIKNCWDKHSYLVQLCLIINITITQSGRTKLGLCKTNVCLFMHVPEILAVNSLLMHKEVKIYCLLFYTFDNTSVSQGTSFWHTHYNDRLSNMASRRQSSSLASKLPVERTNKMDETCAVMCNTVPQRVCIPLHSSKPAVP